MLELNIKFMDLYKSVDRFIKDAYSSTEGVSEYIRIMGRKWSEGRRYVSTWDKDYDMLKHLRWIRNQLSHEVGYDSDICEKSDYEWLETFKSNLFEMKDPLAVLKYEHDEYIRRVEEEHRKKVNQLIQNESYAYMPQKKKSFWQRIKDFLDRNL